MCSRSLRNSVRASVTYSFEFSVPSIPYMTCIHLSPEFNVRNSHREEVFRFSLSLDRALTYSQHAQTTTDLGISGAPRRPSPRCSLARSLAQSPSRSLRRGESCSCPPVALCRRRRRRRRGSAAVHYRFSSACTLQQMSVIKQS